MPAHSEALPVYSDHDSDVEQAATSVRRHAEGGLSSTSDESSDEGVSDGEGEGSDYVERRRVRRKGGHD